MEELRQGAAEQIFCALPKETAEGVVDLEDASGLGITEAQADLGAVPDCVKDDLAVTFSFSLARSRDHAEQAVFLAGLGQVLQLAHGSSF